MVQHSAPLTQHLKSAESDVGFTRKKHRTNMKTKLTVLALMAMLAGAWLAQGGETTHAAGKRTDPTPKPKRDNSSAVLEKNVQLTGSMIKRDVRRSGRITDGPSQVIVIDRESIERSGASSVAQVLSRTGVHR
jgi:hypothetical protein